MVDTITPVTHQHHVLNTSLLFTADFASRTELKAAVDACLKESIRGHCSKGPIGSWDVSQVTHIDPCAIHIICSMHYGNARHTYAGPHVCLLNILQPTTAAYTTPSAHTRA